MSVNPFTGRPPQRGRRRRLGWAIALLLPLGLLALAYATVWLGAMLYALGMSQPDYGGPVSAVFLLWLAMAGIAALVAPAHRRVTAFLLTSALLAFPVWIGIPDVRDEITTRARLDRSNYREINPRDFALIAKDPDSHYGEKIIVYGVIAPATELPGRNPGEVFRSTWFSGYAGATPQSRFDQAISVAPNPKPGESPGVASTLAFAARTAESVKMWVEGAGFYWAGTDCFRDPGGCRELPADFTPAVPPDQKELRLEFVVNFIEVFDGP